MITIFLLVKVVPVFGEIFKSFQAELPAPTQYLINFSDFVKRYIIIILLAGGGGEDLAVGLGVGPGRRRRGRGRREVAVVEAVEHQGAQAAAKRAGAARAGAVQRDVKADMVIQI